MNPAIRKPPAPSLEDLVREFMANTSWPPSVAEMLAFVRSIPPINAEAERAEALRAQRDEAAERALVFLAQVKEARATLARVRESLARIRAEVAPYARDLTNETGADHPNMEGRIVDDCDTALRLIDELEGR